MKSNILLIYFIIESYKLEITSYIFQIISLNDMYKRLQEYNTSLQQYNSKLQSELNQTSETLSKVEREKAALMENLSNLRGYHDSQQDQLVSTKVGYSIISTVIYLFIIMTIS